MIHHSTVLALTPEVAYFGSAALREGKSTFAAFAVTSGGTPAGVD